jgi:hypothetical protein
MLKVNKDTSLSGKLRRRFLLPSSPREVVAIGLLAVTGRIKNWRGIFMKKSNKKTIKSRELDKKFDNNEDLSEYMNFEQAVAVKRVNLDMPKWLLDALDKEALKLNVSRQAIIKMWLSEKIESMKRVS